MTTISDEALMALADGELDAVEAARIRRAINQDPELAARFASFAETRALLSAGGGDTEAEAVPEGLIDAAKRLGDALAKNDALAKKSSSRDGNAARATMARGSEAMSVGSPSSRGKAVRKEASARNDNVSAIRQRPGLGWSIAIAASVALVIGGFAGYLGRSLTTPPGATRMAESAPGFATSPAVAARLSELVSGETREFTEPGSAVPLQITVVSTHQMDHGGVCREFALRQVAASGARQMRVACLTDNAWQTRLVVALPAADQFTPASGSETADHFLEASGSRGVLTGDAERQAIKR
jgi:anti-sigma factor RsiW